jgi:hypothetical protein
MIVQLEARAFRVQRFEDPWDGPLFVPGPVAQVPSESVLREEIVTALSLGPLATVDSNGALLPPTGAQLPHLFQQAADLAFGVLVREALREIRVSRPAHVPWLPEWLAVDCGWVFLEAFSGEGLDTWRDATIRLAQAVHQQGVINAATRADLIGLYSVWRICAGDHRQPAQKLCHC